MQILRARIAAASNLPLPVFEPAQIMHYSVGEEFRPHHRLPRSEDNDGLGGADRPLRPAHRHLPHLPQRRFRGRRDRLSEDRVPPSRPQGRRPALRQCRLRRASARPADLPRRTAADHGEKWILSQWIRDRTGRRSRAAAGSSSRPSARARLRSARSQHFVHRVARQDAGRRDRRLDARPGVPPRSSGLARDAAGEPLGGVDRAVLVEMVEDEAELAAAGAGEDVGRADQAAEQAGDVDEGGVAGEMAVALVDRGRGPSARCPTIAAGVPWRPARPTTRSSSAGSGGGRAAA